MSRRILVIANPTAGGRHSLRLDATLRALTAVGCRIRLIKTAASGDAERFAREAGSGAWDVVAAAGGDGTINEVANGLVGKNIPLGLIPLGTANVLAQELGIGSNPKTVARILASGQSRPIHLGQMGGRRFLVMAGAGFDAFVCSRINLSLKRRIGKLAYIWAALAGACDYGFPQMRVRIDGEELTAYGVIVCNARHYGGPFILAARASLDEATFQVCLLGRPGVGNLFRYASALALGHMERLRDVTIKTGRDIRIDAPPGVPIQGDGDVFARIPAHVSVASETINLLVPDRL